MITKLNPARLAVDHFEVRTFPALLDDNFRELASTVYDQFTSARNASNQLKRGLRWGTYAVGQFIWLDRDAYRLDADKNKEEGGRTRHMDLIPEDFLRQDEIEATLTEVFDAWGFAETSYERAYEVQLSAIRYEVNLAEPALPSPIEPHQDEIDGAIIVLGKTGFLSGGTSRLYSLNHEPLYELDLQVGEALFVRDAQLLHQVTPLQMVLGHTWRPGLRAFRDVLLVRFQPVGRS